MTTHDAALASYPGTETEERCSSGTAFILWLACALGICGVHRFYLGKPITGLLYLFTFGLLGVGQVIDLVMLRGMVREANARTPLLPVSRRRPRALLPAPRVNPAEVARTALLRAAARARGHRLSIAQAVAVTGLSEKEAEKALDQLVLDGKADIDNDPETGAVVYSFSDLS